MVTCLCAEEKRIGLFFRLDVALSFGNFIFGIILFSLGTIFFGIVILVVYSNSLLEFFGFFDALLYDLSMAIAWILSTFVLVSPSPSSVGG